MMIQLFSNIVAIIFFCSGISKVLSFREFRVGLLYIPFVTNIASYAIAFFLPIAEVVFSIGIVLNIEKAKVGVILLCIIFCLTASVILKRNLKVKCNCFMSSNSHFTMKTIYLNCIYIFIVFISFFENSSSYIVTNLLISSAMFISILILNEAYINNKKIQSMVSRKIL